MAPGDPPPPSPPPSGQWPPLGPVVPPPVVGPPPTHPVPGPWPPPREPQSPWPPPGPPAAPWPPVELPPVPLSPGQPVPGPGGSRPVWGGGRGARYGPPPAAAPRTSPLAVAAFVCAALGWWLFGLGALAGIALGIVSLEQIQQSNGSLKGRGWAIAGIAVGAGFSLLFLWAIAVVHR